MPLTGDLDGVKRLRRETLDLADPRGRAQTDIARSVIREVRGVLKNEFATGEGPDGAWERTVRGKPALISKKLPQDFTGKTVPGGALFESRIGWLRAHHEGHVFPSRAVAANKNYLTFDKRGRLIKASKALNKKGQVRRGVTQTFARAHTIGQRILKARPIYPTGAMPPKWADSINRGASAAMTRWQARAAKV